MTVDDAIPGNSVRNEQRVGDLVAERDSGFSLRLTYRRTRMGRSDSNTGKREPKSAHSHPGDDMTIVVEGRCQPSAIDDGDYVVEGERSFSVRRRRITCGPNSRREIYRRLPARLPCTMVAFAFLPADLDIG